VPFLMRYCNLLQMTNLDFYLEVGLPCKFLGKPVEIGRGRKQKALPSICLSLSSISLLLVMVGTCMAVPPLGRNPNSSSAAKLPWQIYLASGRRITTFEVKWKKNRRNQRSRSTIYSEDSGSFRKFRHMVNKSDVWVSKHLCHSWWDIAICCSFHLHYGDLHVVMIWHMYRIKLHNLPECMKYLSFSIWTKTKDCFSFVLSF
jgi:hypothetical protein